jgi:acylphosphatase
LRISGRVQGVCFRAYTQRKAQSLGLSGYVRNLADGNVEAVFEGARDRVRSAVSWCYRGPDAARVDSVDVEWMDATGEDSGFRVRF